MRDVESTSSARARSKSERRPRLIGAFNVVCKLVLRSPIHGVMSDKLALLTFTGRKTGRSYTTPVSYIVETDSTLLVAGGAPWWKNLQTGAPVRIQLRGRERLAHPEVIRDPIELARLLQVILPRNPTLGRFMGLRLGADGQVDPTALAVAQKRGLALVRLRLDPEVRR